MPGEGRIWDVAIVGAGPGGLFAAGALAGKLSVLVLDEKGRTGGAGAMTDGKLNLSPHIGLDLAELSIGEEEALERIARIDEAFLRHGADPTVYGEDRERIGTWLDRVSWARRRTPKGEWDITLLPARQRHMGTDLAHRVVARMTQAIASAGAEFSLKTRVETVRRRSGGPFILRTTKGEFFARYVLAAPGRDGAYWFREEARGLGVSTRYGAIDIGCRVEVASPVYEEITRVLYDPKFLFVTPTHGDRTRTFCTNPGGRVRVEVRDGFRLVNGDALKARKTPNTNFAILNTVSMTEPVQDTTEMGRKVAEFANFWGGGRSLVVQRFGDLMGGRRSRAETFHSAEAGYDKMTPTLPPGEGVTPGDISFAYPGRIVDNLRESLMLLSRVIPGVAHPSTAIYVPEIKFYDTKYATDRNLETTVPNLFVAGDGVGKSRGIVGAALNGCLAAEGILRKEGKALL
ncbi:MAG: FAD-dependent oxidoreductase [Deltaproteobacteria bacterium]|nr:MAG: FAD-dependent oxidoreductase [Deltaproteobacteria bacterium]